LDFFRVQVIKQRRTSQVQRIGGFRRVKVSADGKGVVSHAGIGLLRDMAEATGLDQGISGALIDTYRTRRMATRSAARTPR